MAGRYGVVVALSVAWMTLVPRGGWKANRLSKMRLLSTG